MGGRQGGEGEGLYQHTSHSNIGRTWSVIISSVTMYQLWQQSGEVGESRREAPNL